jgi:hypothetical protein
MSVAGEGHHETEKPHGGDHHHGQHHDESTIMPFYTPPKQRQRWGDEQLPVHNNWGDIFFDLFYVALACECMDLSLVSGEERIFAFDGRMMCLTRPTLVALSLSLSLTLSHLEQTTSAISCEKIRPGEAYCTCAPVSFQL